MFNKYSFSLPELWGEGDGDWPTVVVGDGWETGDVWETGKKDDWKTGDDCCTTGVEVIITIDSLDDM